MGSNQNVSETLNGETVNYIGHILKLLEQNCLKKLAIFTPKDKLERIIGRNTENLKIYIKKENIFLKNSVEPPWGKPDGFRLLQAAACDATRITTTSIGQEVVPGTLPI